MTRGFGSAAGTVWLVLAAGFAAASPGDHEPWGATLHQRWTLDDGLPQGSPTKIVEDHRGYLWVATFGGLARFDGARFVTFSKRNVPGLASDRWINAAISGHSLWLVSEAGHLQELELHQVWPQAKPPFAVGAWDVYPRRQGGVWWAGGDAVGWAEGQTVEVLWREPGEGVLFRTLTEIEPGVLLVGGLKGLWILSERGITPHPEPALRATSVLHVVARADGEALVGTGSGVWLASRTGARLLVGGVAANRVCLRSSGELWYGVDHRGLWRSTPAGAEALPPAFGFSQLRILSLWEDRHGALWAGVDGMGLYRFSVPQARGIVIGDVPVAVRGLELAPDDTVWAGLGCSGLARIREGQVVQRVRTDPCVDSVFWTGSELLLGTSESGLFRLHGDRAVPVPGPQAFSGAITSFCRLSSSEILVGGEGGLGIFDGERLTAIPEWSQQSVVSLTCDGDRIFVGTPAGLLELDRDSRDWRRRQEIAVGAPVRAVMPLDDGSLLLATYGRGLVLLDREGRLLDFPRGRGLDDTMLSALVESPPGVLWISGNRGLAVVDKGELLRAFFQDETLCPRVFGAKAGLPASECNGGRHRPFILDREEKLWIPTVAGVGVVDTKRLRFLGEPPRVYIEEITEAGRSLFPEAEVHLERTSRNIGIRFSALGPEDRDEAIFRWRFADREQGWQVVGKRRTLFFEGLPPGRSILEVSARTPTSSWGAPASLVLFRRPAFAETAWFYLVLVLAGVAGGAVFWFGRSRALERRAEWLEREVQARTREREELERFIAAVNEGQSLEEVLERVFEGLRRLLPFEHLCCWLLAGPQLQRAWCSAERQSPMDAPGCHAALAQELASLVAQAPSGDEQRLQRLARVSLACRPEAGPVWVLSLEAFGRQVGFLSFVSSDRHLERFGDTLRLVGAQLSVIVEKARLMAELAAAKSELERLAVTDELTGLANRRAFYLGLEKAWRAAWRAGRPIALIFADIDHFKGLNDALGHETGDRCLVEVAGVIRGFARREEDLAARWGGEELVLVLPGMDLAQARSTAEKIRAAVEALGFPHPASPVAPVVTVSLGVASTVPGAEGSWQLLWTEADLALYRAKQSGRNCVMCAC